MIQALDPVVIAWLGQRAVEVAGQGVAENVADQGAFARAAHARHADEQAERDRDIHVFEVIVPCADDRQKAAIGGLPLGGDRDLLAAGEIRAGYALAAAGEFRQISLGDDIPALDAGTGTEIDEEVGRAHGVLVVLDDDDRVADVPQTLQRGDQAIVVARMQTDRRLVQDVEHADQPRADLRRQADALGLAAGERRRDAVERQVVQADIDEEPETSADLLQQLVGDLARERVERRRRIFGQEVGRCLTRQGIEPAGDLSDRQVP